MLGVRLLTRMSICDRKKLIYSYITIAHSIKLKLEVIFRFLKVKSYHFLRFYGCFSDFWRVAYGDILKSRR